MARKALTTPTLPGRVVKGQQKDLGSGYLEYQEIISAELQAQQPPEQLMMYPARWGVHPQKVLSGKLIVLLPQWRGLQVWVPVPQQRVRC
jgi:hypothetical protein